MARGVWCGAVLITTALYLGKYSICLPESWNIVLMHHNLISDFQHWLNHRRYMYHLPLRTEDTILVNAWLLACWIRISQFTKYSTMDLVGWYCTVRNLTHVHSVQQKSIGLKFSKSQTGSDVRYSCHHNSSRFTFPIFAHSCRFCVFHSLQSITPRIY